MADSAMTGTTPLWRITGQTVGMQPDASGAFVKGMNVHFQTRSGLTGGVFIPDAQYNSPGAPELISDRVDAQAKQMEQISSLQG